MKITKNRCYRRSSYNNWVVRLGRYGAISINQGLGRTPGLLIGGTLTDAPDDFTPLNDSVRAFVHETDWFPSPCCLFVLGGDRRWCYHCNSTG